MASSIKITKNDLQQKLERKLQQSVSKAVKDRTKQAVFKTPVKTGRLKGSWKSHFVGWNGSITNSALYALYIEFGTSRHNAGRSMIGWRSGRTAIEIAELVIQNFNRK